jgi:hypothetical protein
MVVEKARDLPDLTPAMAEAVVAFLRAAWPVQEETEPQRQGWPHLSSTSCQIACMALVALGEAEETGWGAVPLAEPRRPDALPFWEDIAVAVLWLAQQQNLLSYRQMDGSPPEPRMGGFAVRRIGGPPLPPPDILAGPGSGPAGVADIAVQVLEALGLVCDGRWTVAAETVLWRGMPRAWGLRFDEDGRFLEAVDRAAATMPLEVGEEIARLMRISETDVAAGVARSELAHEALRLRFGRPSARPPDTAEQVRRSLPHQRENDLDWIFFRHWRLGRGWLDEGEASRRLEIFHDGLATAMRKAVVARLYPDGFVWE